ncbi:MAG: Sua5/YciO/YrdC/YwlC family protein [bacterium]
MEKINMIKKKNLSKKLTIIAPSFDWIFENFIVPNPDDILESFNKYHGITYILHPKEGMKEYSLYETAYEDKTIGVRIIKHPMQEFITYLGKPFISTSANFA